LPLTASGGVWCRWRWKTWVWVMACLEVMERFSLVRAAGVGHADPFAPPVA